MKLTRILWIDDFPGEKEFALGNLVIDYQVDLKMAITNSDALEKIKDPWDIVFYDLGMDPGYTQGDMQFVRKIRTAIGETPLIGTSLTGNWFYGIGDDCDQIIESFGLNHNKLVSVIREYDIDIKHK